MDKEVRLEKRKWKHFWSLMIWFNVSFEFFQPGAGELDPRRRSRESHLQGAPASLLPGEGGFQQGQGFSETHGAGERAEHQAVEAEPSTSQCRLNASVKAVLGTKTQSRCSPPKHWPSPRVFLFYVLNQKTWTIHVFFFVVARPLKPDRRLCKHG